jgi:hypothetical protein
LPPIETKLKTFKEITGKTQGMRLRMRPPINAKIMAFHNDKLGAFVSVS